MCSSPRYSHCAGETQGRDGRSLVQRTSRLRMRIVLLFVEERVVAYSLRAVCVNCRPGIEYSPGRRHHLVCCKLYVKNPLFSQPVCTPSITFMCSMLLMKGSIYVSNGPAYVGRRDALGNSVLYGLLFSPPTHTSRFFTLPPL